MGETLDYIEGCIARGECDENGEIFYDIDSYFSEEYEDEEDYYEDEDEEDYEDEEDPEEDELIEDETEALAWRVYLTLKK